MDSYSRVIDMVVFVLSPVNSEHGLGYKPIRIVLIMNSTHK